MMVIVRFADVAELADALDLGSSSSRSEGSSPFIRIKTKKSALSSVLLVECRFFV